MRIPHFVLVLVSASMILNMAFAKTTNNTPDIPLASPEAQPLMNKMGGAYASPRRVIIDQDTTGPGTTNTVSIAALLLAENVQVEGISVATGDGWVGEEVMHVLRLLEPMNRTDVPVYFGSTGPLLPLSRNEVLARSSLSGHASWLGAWASDNSDPYCVNHSNHTFPEGLPAIQAQNMSASEFIARTVRDNPGEISILALAPMSNIAGAMMLEPRLPALAKELVFMGGAVACGKTTKGAHCDKGQLWHEFNMWFDPHSAKKALRVVPHVTGNWSHVVTFPADVASQPTWDSNLQAAVRSLQEESKAADYIVRYLFGTKNEGFAMFDELTVVFWANCDTSAVQWQDDSSPLDGCAMVSGAQRMDIDVSTEEASRGLLLTWREDEGPGLGEQTATVFLGQVDIKAFQQRFVAMLRKSPSP